MTSLLDCQIFSWKVFLVKYLCWNFFSKLTPNGPKCEKNGCRFGQLVGPPSGPNLTGNHFSDFLSLQMIQNVKKTSCRFCQPVGWPDRPPDWIFTSDCFFTFWIIWSWFGNKIFNQNFDQKNLWTVIWQSMTSSCAVNFEIFLVKNFPKKWH